MIEILASDVILLLMSIISAAITKRVMVSLAVGGILVIVLTAGYMKDNGDRLLNGMQLVLSFLFVFCSGAWWTCIIFALLLWQKKWLAFVCAGASLLVVSLFTLFTPGFSSAGSPGKLSAGYAAAVLIVRLGITGLIILLIFSFRSLINSIQISRQADRLRIIERSLSSMHEIQKNKELVKQSFYIDKNARLMERENISRNIHNSVGHSITAAIMSLDAADVLFDKKPEEAHKRMNDAALRIRGSLESIRSAVRALDAEGADVSVKDLLCYFDNILDEFLMDTDRGCERIYDIYSEDYSIPGEHAEFLTGALSELLTNGVKHGGATHFIVHLSGDKAHIKLELADNGQSDYDEEKSAERIKNGFGLKKLTAYAKRAGGRTEFYNDNGFHSVIELPF